MPYLYDDIKHVKVGSIVERIKKVFTGTNGQQEDFLVLCKEEAELKPEPLRQAVIIRHKAVNYSQSNVSKLKSQPVIRENKSACKDA